MVLKSMIKTWRRSRGTLAVVTIGLCGCWGEFSSPPIVSRPDAPARTDRSVAVARPSGREIPFTVPRRFMAERVAEPPLTTHPMFASFDDHGRLYVAASAGTELNPEKRKRTPPDSIRVLEDTDGDGRFDKSHVFADKLTYPQGVLWHDGAVFTASPPSLWRLEDTDGDGVADQRRELVTGFPFTGIADDMHGPCLGPDGRIYWGVGRFPYDIHGPGGETIRKGSSPLIMRCTPAGDEIEVFSAAMGNPVETAFTAEGEPFACGTFLAPESMGLGLRDAIIHCVFGGVYSVRDRNFLEDKRTGELLPPLCQLGVSAGSGLLRARGGSFGDDDHTFLYSAQFNLRSVFHHRIERDGATFRSRDEPFLTSQDIDFHPTDVLEDADGSLLVIDTGAWFTHCPTSQIGKQNIFGGIYRIRRRDAKPPSDPRGLALEWKKATSTMLAQRLDDPRFAVRDRAVEALAKRGQRAVQTLRRVLRDAPSVRARRNAVWALARLEEPGARWATRSALSDRDASVRLAATNATGLYRDVDAIARLRTMVVADTAPIRREAATALGRIRHPEVVPALLESLRGHGDRFLEHAVIYAMIALGDRKSTLPGLRDPNPRVVHGSLIALDQMEGGGLTPALVVPLLDRPEPEIRQAALQVVAKRPSWAGRVVGLFRRWLARDSSDDKRREELRARLLAFSRTPEIQTLIADELQSTATATGVRVLLLETMARAPVDETPAAWTPALEAALHDRSPRVVRQAVATAHARATMPVDNALLTLARDTSRPDDVRVEALETIAQRVPELEPPLFSFVYGCLGPDKPPLLRISAARALGQSTLSAGQLDKLTDAVASAGPLVLPPLLDAFSKSPDLKVGTRLITALGTAPGLPSLNLERLTLLINRFPAEVQRQAQSVMRQLRIDDEARVSRLDELEPILTHGSPQRGQEVFFSAKAVCSMCHTVNGQGGHVGPDLSRIGSIRSGRDLLEAILFPSSSFARGYEPFVVATIDGQVFNGVIHRETADAIVLVTNNRVEKRVPRSSIEAIEQSQTSVMPRGLDANLSHQELADLIAFLQSLR